MTVIGNFVAQKSELYRDDDAINLYQSKNTLNFWYRPPEWIPSGWKMYYFLHVSGALVWLYFPLKKKMKITAYLWTSAFLFVFVYAWVWICASVYALKAWQISTLMCMLSPREHAERTNEPCITDIMHMA